MKTKNLLQKWKMLFPLLLLLVFWSGGLFAQQTPDILDQTVPEYTNIRTIARMFKIKKGARLVMKEENVLPRYSDLEYFGTPNILVTVILDENVSLSEINEDNPLFYLDFKYNNISHVNVSGATQEVYKKIKYLEGSRTKIAILDSYRFFFYPYTTDGVEKPDPNFIVSVNPLIQVDPALNLKIMPAPDNFKKIRYTDPQYYSKASFIYASMIMQPPEQRTIRKIKITDRVTATDGKLLLPKGYFHSAPNWKISNQLYEDYEAEESIPSFSSDYEISLVDIKNEIERHYGRSGLFFLSVHHRGKVGEQLELKDGLHINSSARDVICIDYQKTDPNTESVDVTIKFDRNKGGYFSQNIIWSGGDLRYRDRGFVKKGSYVKLIGDKEHYNKDNLKDTIPWFVSIHPHEGYMFNGWRHKGQTTLKKNITFQATDLLNSVELLFLPINDAHTVHLSSTGGGGRVSTINMDGREDSSPTQKVPRGYTLKLKAEVTDPYTYFKGWYKNGEFESSNLEHTVEIIESTNFKAEFVANGMVDVSYAAEKMYPHLEEIGGTVAPISGFEQERGRYVGKARIDSDLILQAIKKEGFDFLGWFTRDATNSYWVKLSDSLKYRFTVVADLGGRFPELSALFGKKLKLELRVSEGGQVFKDGEQVTSETFKAHEKIPMRLKAEAANGYRFVGWYLDGVLLSNDEEYEVNSYEFRTSNRTLEARFGKPINLRIEYQEHESVSVGFKNPDTNKYMGSPVRWYSKSPIDLYFFNGHYALEFHGWYVGDSLLSEKMEYRMIPKKDMTITAKYDYKEVKLTLSAASGGQILGDLERKGKLNGKDNIFIVTAKPDKGYRFLGWCEKGNNNCSYVYQNETKEFELFKNEEWEAHFEKINNVSDGGENSSDGGGNSSDGGENSSDGGENASDGGGNASDGGENSSDGGENASDGGGNSSDGGENSSDSGGNSSDSGGNSSDGGGNASDGGEAPAPVLPEPKFTLTLSATEGGSINGELQRTLERGSSVTLEARTLEGYDFDGWYDVESNERVSQNLNYTFSIDKNLKLQARFVQSRMVTLTLSATEGGSINGELQRTLERGSSVTLEARTTEGYDFDGWYDIESNERVSQNLNYTFSIDKNLKLQARFVKKLLKPITELAFEAQELQLKLGESRDLTLQITPADTTDPQVFTWESSNQQVVSVSEQGRIQAHALGVAQLTVRAKNGVSATLLVLVLTSSNSSDSAFKLPYLLDLQDSSEGVIMNTTEGVFQSYWLELPDQVQVSSMTCEALQNQKKAEIQIVGPQVSIQGLTTGLWKIRAILSNGMTIEYPQVQVR